MLTSAFTHNIQIILFSKALSNYPQFRFRDGQKCLWNPILKKTFVNLPEERVRLKLIDHFILEAGIPKSRISFESPVKLETDKSNSRTDIICYDKEFKPLLLVECKAPSIKIDEKAAIQVARYNQKVGAPFVLVSNGVLDFWFEVDDDQIKVKQEIPQLFRSKNEIEKNLTYWEDRGFIGEKLSPEAREFARKACNELFENAHQPVKFLSFDEYPQDFALGHYYRIFGLENNVKIAVSVSANAFGGTRLNVVLNQVGANTAFCTASLDLIAEREPLNSEIHSSKGVFEVDFREETNNIFESKITELITQFQNLLVAHS